MTSATLFDYYRSSASYRVRIALNLKGIAYRSIAIDLAGGAQKQADYRARNPQGFVPMLEMDGQRLTQSLAIVDYLDSAVAEPRLIPARPAERAHVLALALTIACDIHPLNNLRVLKYLAGPLGQAEEERNLWYAHWVREGFQALQALAEPQAGRFLFGDSPGLADLFLVPQMYNARRLSVPLDDFPLLVRIDAEACRLESFASAHPDAVSPSAVPA